MNDRVTGMMASLQDVLDVNSPRASIIFAYSLIEVFIGDLIGSSAIHKKAYANLSPYTKTCLCHDLGKLSQAEFERLEWLRRQRNAAAHNPTYQPDISSIKNKWIMSDMRGMDRLKAFLVCLIGDMWNKHRELRESVDNR
jgi:hypothetical protein